ncbi:FAD-dependent oxidoreductase [Aromatoleum toluclasticum]|uniref:FAD-dependent oxidoreductase n=1 Tax=Aromatoleum toluclasticum TaxID=92003 RepID=UPI0003647781|nr:FAD-dependent oxidoreductase [Aromatoleum toluclasticum]MCC4114810.1 FAD-dependent oxidoreductase [Aromatoleum toluclasticum]
MQRDFDVVVVGGGGAGLCAAIEAQAAGASVMVLEADTHVGGATLQSGGVFYAAGTSVQKARGVHDTADAMYEYVMNLNQWEFSPAIVRLLCDRGPEAIDWLIGHGAEFPPEWLMCSGVDSVPRGHPSRGGAGSVGETIVRAFEACSVETAVATRVESLVVEDGRVVGVRAAGAELRAGAVVVTTGGFGNSREMIERYWPSMAYHGDRVYAVHWHAPFILGDGLRMGEEVGANIVGFDTGLPLPASGAAGRVVEPFLPPWIMLVNREGRRFMDETVPYSVSGYILNSQTDRRAFAIFDEPTLANASVDTAYSDPYHSELAATTWDHQTIRDRIAKGEVFVADSIGALARKIGVDPISLGVTVENYNADCDCGIDGEFLKQAERRFAVRKAPFYAIEVRASVIGWTSCGPEIDGQCRVLDKHQRRIPGLFAAGEVVGGIQGKRYAGGGLSIANAVILGRLAGQNAARAAAR